MGYGYYLALCSESSNGYYEFFPSCSTGHSRDLPSLFNAGTTVVLQLLKKEEELLLQAQ